MSVDTALYALTRYEQLMKRVGTDYYGIDGLSHRIDFANELRGHLVRERLDALQDAIDYKLRVSPDLADDFLDGWWEYLGATTREEFAAILAAD